MVNLSSLRQNKQDQQGTSGLDSSEVSALSGSGTSVFDALDSLPTTGLTAGSKALVENVNRLYISDGSGWYNIDLNTGFTPYWLTEPDATYEITDSVTPLLVTAKALDSDGTTPINQSFASDSAQYMVTITNDSSVFTFTPKSADSIGIEVGAGNLTDSNGDFIYTFKWSDGINFVSKSVTIGYNAAGGGSFVDLSNVSYDNKSFSVATIGSQNTSSWEVDFNTDGTKMYVLDSNSDSIYQFSLSTAWDITTASYDNVYYSAGSQGNVRGSAFSADGTKLFIVENTGTHEVHQYSLSTAWDLSTVSYDNIKLNPLDDVSSIGTYFYSVAFSTDGTKMFAAGSYITGTSSLILSYSLSTGYDLSTASYDNVSFNHSSQTPDLKRIVFNSDGTQFFHASGSQQKIYQYSMTTAYDLSTASYDNKTFSTASQETGVNNSVKFSTDGTKMYILGFGTDTVYQYSTTSLSGGGSGSSIAWGGDRAIVAAGLLNTLTASIDYYSISALSGTASDFGDLTTAQFAPAACSNSTYGLVSGGNASNNSGIANIDYITIATTGNGIDFGDLTQQRYGACGCSDGTYGIFSGGVSGSTFYNIMDYVTVSNPSNATDFGDNTESRVYSKACSDSTRGLIGGGFTTSARNTIDYVTIASPGNAVDFGDLTVGRYFFTAISDATRGVFGQGYGGLNTIDYITIQTTGNATDFGDALSNIQQRQASSDGTYGTFAGGEPDGLSTKVTDIEYITIQTTGNGTDFGDLSVTRGHGVGTSGASS